MASDERRPSPLRGLPSSGRDPDVEVDGDGAGELLELDPHTPPAHLAPATAAWWSDTVASFELEPHHLLLLTLSAQAWDRAEGARVVIAAEGITYADRFGAPRVHPAVAVERDARLAFARLVRELALDDSAPGDPRPPRVGGRS